MLRVGSFAFGLQILKRWVLNTVETILQFWKVFFS